MRFLRRKPMKTDEQVRILMNVPQNGRPLVASHAVPPAQIGPRCPSQTRPQLNVLLLSGQWNSPLRRAKSQPRQ